jgi:hypothetical protein
MHCQDCKHWSFIRNEDFELRNGETWEGPHGECNCIDEFSLKNKAWTYCGDSNYCGNCLDKLIECPKCQSEPNHEPHLITKASFGCVLFEKK